MPRSEVVKVSRVWHSPDGEPWLVTFDLAELGGRPECIGISLRSYLALRTPSDEGQTSGRERLQAVWEPLDLDPEEFGRLLQGEAEAQGEHTSGEFMEVLKSAPRRLTAVRYRSLPLADVLQRARRGTGSFLRALNEVRARHGGTVDDGAETLAAQLDLPHGRPKGRSRHTQSELKDVAALYTGAVSEDRPSPTKDVADALGMTRNVAAKLVMKCRREGLLPPAPPPGRGGWLASDDEASPGPSRKRGRT